MKAKLILVLSLLFNFIILNSCGPAFWRQAVEDHSEYYAQVANREILRRERLRRQFVTIHPSDRALTREVFLKIWEFVKDFPLEQKKIYNSNNVQEISYLPSAEEELPAFYIDVNNLCPHQQVQS